jgi:hypothetical protein
MSVNDFTPEGGGGGGGVKVSQCQGQPEECSQESVRSTAASCFTSILSHDSMYCTALSTSDTFAALFSTYTKINHVPARPVYILHFFPILTLTTTK